MLEGRKLSGSHILKSFRSQPISQEHVIKWGNYQVLMVCSMNPSVAERYLLIFEVTLTSACHMHVIRSSTLTMSVRCLALETLHM